MAPPAALQKVETLSGTLSRRQQSLSGTLAAQQTLRGSLATRALGGATDYNLLTNRPSIESVVLEGNVTLQELGLGNVYCDTTANWDAQLDLVAKHGAVYIYSDHAVIRDEVGNPVYVAGIKIGDGTSFLADMPFVGDEMAALLLAHIGDATVHLTDAEREFWNNKVTAYLDAESAENLVLSKTNHVEGS